MAALSTFDLSDGLVAVSNLKYKSPTLQTPFILENNCLMSIRTSKKTHQISCSDVQILANSQDLNLGLSYVKV